jgi:hypothetical protein
MSQQSFVLPAAADRDDMLGRILRFAHQLAKDKRWRVTIEPYVKRRSNSQNAYLWGVVYPTILQAMPSDLAGWTADEVHEFFLGEHFGWERVTGFGKTKQRPIRRSSKLSTLEFQDYVAFIQQFMAEKGVYVPDPGEDVGE